MESFPRRAKRRAADAAPSSVTEPYDQQRIPDVSQSDNQLIDVLRRHEIELPADQIELLGRYAEIVWEWNEKINLTRHTDFEKFVSRDVVDSLAFAKFIKPGEEILDVGSGGGVPGVLLAILRPDVKVTLSESVGKKSRVLEDVVARLGLKVDVFAGRAEELLKKRHFDALTVRAVAPMKKILEFLKLSWPSFGRLLLLKGPSWVEERGEARHFGLMHEIALRKLYSYPLPGTESESVMLLLCPKDRLGEFVDGKEE